MARWHEYDISDVAMEFGTDIRNGRTVDSDDKRRRGKNNIFLLPSADAGSVIKQLLSDASFMLLAVTYILASFMGHLHESVAGIVLIVSVFLFAFFVKYSSSKRISNSYRMLLPVSKITENGNNIRLSVFDVDIGDLISFSKGDIIPADARIVSADGLVVAERKIDEKSGKLEYKKTNKDSAVMTDADAVLDSYTNMVYAGSMVISGKGSAIVTETGEDTVIGSIHSGIKLVPSNDTPVYLRKFYSSSKKVSLAVFFAVVPFTLVSILLQTLTKTETAPIDLLYLFLTMLSLAVSCMSEIAVAPAETLVTKEILLSSRAKKAKSNVDSRITKLSSAESLADADTMLILNPEVLVDSENTVRRVWFADKQYRFDSLRSKDLDAFYSVIDPLFRFTRSSGLPSDHKAILNFLNDISFAREEITAKEKPRIVKNFPLMGSRACVFKLDAEGRPIHYTACVTDPSILDKCKSIRTEGGGLWKLERSSYDSIIEQYNKYMTIGLKTFIFVSLLPGEKGAVFEGLLAVGNEYPFANGELAEELAVSGINPILVLNEESSANVNLAKLSGLTDGSRDIAVASEYVRNGLSITDAPLTTKVYIGFGASAVSELTTRLIKNGRKILPIIKDSSDRKAVSPLNVYATSGNSYDSIRISSSLSLREADSVTREGGLYDALKMVRGSSIARLKLGIYRNYLSFSMFVRIVAVCLPLILGKTALMMSTLMILLSGFVCDAVALVSLMMASGIPVKPKNAASDANKLFSSALFISFAIAGAITASVVLLITDVLLATGKLTSLVAPGFVMHSINAAQIFATGALLLILNKRSKRKKINWCYLLCTAVSSALLILQSRLSDKVYSFFNLLGFYKLSFNQLSYILISASAGVITVLIISALLSAFSSSRNN